MRVGPVVFCLLVACAVTFAEYTNGPVVGILQGAPVEPVPENQLVYVQPGHTRQKRGLILAHALGAGLLGVGALGAVGALGVGALGVGALGAGLVGAKAGLVGGALAGRALSGGYGGYGGYGGSYGGGYGGGYHGGYYVVDEGYGW